MDKTVYEAKIVGIRPLLMHNGRLADPLDPMTRRLKELTGKRQKSDEDHAQIARAEWEGGLYVLDGGVAIPAELIDAAMRDGAKAQRNGKAMVAGVEIEDLAIPVEHDGPKDWRKLYDFAGPNDSRPYVDRRGAGVQRARVIRTRPKFIEWALTFRIARYAFASVGEKEIRAALEHAGLAVGIGDFRPRFGLFRVESFKKVS